MMDVEALLEAFVESCRAILGGGLTGVYLHGSLVMGCFNPDKSDIDLIVVTETEPDAAQKRRLMDMAVALDAKAPKKGIEFSVVSRAACDPFVYPAPFTLHWSRAHAEWYRRDPDGYVARMNGTDADLAAHFTVIRHRGRALFGAPVEVVFGEVPRADYLDSIWRDVEGAREDILGDPVYVALNLCRVLAFVREGAVLSKQEGGEWGMANLPQPHRSIARDALKAYGTDGELTLDAAAAQQFAEYMLEKIEAE